MKSKKVVSYLIGILILVLAGRSYYIFSQNAQDKNIPLIEKIVLTDEAPYSYQMLFAPFNHINYYVKGESNKSGLIFIFGDSFCHDEFSYTRKTYPYRLFNKLTNNNNSAKVLSICPSELSSNELIPAITKYIPNFSPTEKNFALIALGFYDPFRKMLPSTLAQPELTAPAAIFSLTASRSDELSTYLKWKYLQEKPLWSEEKVDLLPFANAFSQITIAKLNSYSAEKREFQFKRKELLAEISNLKNLPAPILYFWKQLIAQSEITNVEIFEQLVAFTYFFSVPAQLIEPYQNIILAVAKKAPDLLRSGSLQEATLNYTLMIPPSLIKGFLQKLRGEISQKTTLDALASLFVLETQYDKFKIEMKKNYRLNMIAAFELLKKKNVTPILLTYPYEAHFFPNNEIRELAKELKIPLIDVAGELEKRKTKADNFYNLRTYLSPAGHNEVSRILYETLKKNYLK